MSERVLSEERRSDRLAARRRRSHRRVFTLLALFFILRVVATGYGLRQNAVRIAHVQVFGSTALQADVEASIVTATRQAMQGTYFGVIPRDSIFFFPADRIRSELLSAHPEIAALSFFRDGLTGLSIRTTTRVPIARWCGLAPMESVEVYCYFFDAKGYLFAAAASTTPTINPFRVYAPLAGDTLEPLRATLAHADDLPSIFDFARQLENFGATVQDIVIHGDEVDDYLTDGTRVVSLLGDEQNAFTALVSARDHINLSDHSLEYVDLRFSGKVYVKKKI